MLEIRKVDNNPQRYTRRFRKPTSITRSISFVGTWILDRLQDKLDVRQYGALKGRSTTRALVDMMHHWHKAVDDGQSVRAVFVDFAKAFDHIDHNILIANLTEFGLPDVVSRWTCSFFVIGVNVSRLVK